MHTTADIFVLRFEKFTGHLIQQKLGMRAPVDIGVSRVAVPGDEDIALLACTVPVACLTGDYII